MIRTVLLATALSFSLPALAQHADHDHSEMDHSKMDHGESHKHDEGHAHGDEHAHTGEMPANLHADIDAALAKGGELVQVDMLGMVCDFCATAMNKTFGRRDEVSAVYVDLDTKVLSLVVSEGETLDDETITNLITKAGYKTEAIRRSNGA